MFKVKILSIGKAREPWLKEALGEYEKRLKARMQIDWVLAESEKQLLQQALKEPYLIALDRTGVFLDSETLSQKLFLEWGSRACFLIGGPEGLSPAALSHARFLWSLSPLTFTHQIARLLLVEQLYRAVEIDKKSGYHK